MNIQYPISAAKRREIDENPFYRTCIHKMRPDVTHECTGRITMEHFLGRGRKGRYKDMVLPCCEAMNIGVSGIDKKWNKLVGIKLYRKELEDITGNKVDWGKELNFYQSFFI